MRALGKFEQIYLYRPYIDFRKGILGLSLFIQEELEMNPFENSLFLFTNQKRDRIKAVFWDHTGFAMFYKILEAEKYRWPFHLTDNVIEVDVKKLNVFLEGLNPWEKKHKKLNYSVI
jgi:transposase